jgi:hypothetical protein
MYGQPLNNTKSCSLCQSKGCIKGEYIVNPEDVYRQKWVCKTCIIKGTSSFIKKAIEKGTLSASIDTRARVAPTCPMTCSRKLPDGPTCIVGVPSQNLKESKMR